MEPVNFVITIRAPAMTAKIEVSIPIETIANIIGTETDDNNIKPSPERKKENMLRSKLNILIADRQSPMSLKSHINQNQNVAIDVCARILTTHDCASTSGGCMILKLTHNA